MGLWGKSLSFVGSSWNFVSGCIKNIDTHHESFSSKKQVIKKLSPKNLWQTYMKWTVGEMFRNSKQLCLHCMICSDVLNSHYDRNTSCVILLVQLAIWLRKSLYTWICKNTLIFLLIGSVREEKTLRLVCSQSHCIALIAIWTLWKAEITMEKQGVLE